jgi:hypothetical protein
VGEFVPGFEASGRVLLFWIYPGAREVSCCPPRAVVRADTLHRELNERNLDVVVARGADGFLPAELAVPQVDVVNDLGNRTKWRQQTR